MNFLNNFKRTKFKKNLKNQVVIFEYGILGLKSSKMIF